MLLVCARAELVCAADSAGNWGIIEQTISVPFRPVSVFALIANKKGKVEQYHAVAVPMTPGATEVEVGQMVTVGSVVPVPAGIDKDEVFHYTFFLASLNGEFAATEIKSWSWKELQANSQDADVLEHQRDQLEKEIPPQRDANAKLELRVNQLRDQASKIAGVDDILDLKSELASLQGVDGKKKVTEFQRINELVKAGRATPEPLGADDMRQNLASQLRQVSITTAEVDRLGTSRHDSAVSEYRRKLAMAKEADSADPQALAQEILALRKQRKELEGRLNLNSDAGGDRDF